MADKTKADWPDSIAATGLALTAYPLGVERGYLSRDEAVARVLTTAIYFDHETADEHEIRTLADKLYRRAALHSPALARLD